MKAKKAIVSSTFHEKLYFDENKCRTPLINEVLLRALNADNGFRKSESVATPKNLLLSTWVEIARNWSNPLESVFRKLITKKAEAVFLKAN